MNNLEFVPIKDFPAYSVCKEGYIKNNVKEVILNPPIDRGYYKISVRCPRTKKVCNLRVHRIVAETFLDNPNNLPVVDHLDRNRLNNDVSNLRWAEIQENNQNLPKRKGGTSQYMGVCWDKYKNRWSAEISINNRRTKLGLFKDELQAAMAYNQKAIELGFLHYNKFDSEGNFLGV